MPGDQNPRHAGRRSSQRPTRPCTPAAGEPGRHRIVRLPDTDHRLSRRPGTTTPLLPGTRCPVTGSAKAPRGRRPGHRSRCGPRSAGARPPHRRRRASGSTPPATPPAAPGSCAGPGTGRFLLPRRCVQRREHSRHRPVSGVQRTVLAAVTGQDAFGCVLAGSRVHNTNSSTPGRGNPPAPRTRRSPVAFFPPFSNPLPISQRRHGIAVLRQRPSSLRPAPGPASRAARACKVWIDVLREGAPSGGGLALDAPPSPGRPASDPFLAEIAVHYSTFAAGHPRRRDRMARRSQTSGQ